MYDYDSDVQDVDVGWNIPDPDEVRREKSRNFLLFLDWLVRRY